MPLKERWKYHYYGLKLAFSVDNSELTIPKNFERLTLRKKSFKIKHNQNQSISVYFLLLLETIEWAFQCKWAEVCAVLALVSIFIFHGKINTQPWKSLHYTKTRPFFIIEVHMLGKPMNRATLC